MCGLAGVLQNNQAEGDLATCARRMSDALKHRGPDGGGLWVDQDAGVALSHRRLAILDLSIEGHQPMFSEGGRYVIAFNGEIYNHHAIRADLEALGRAPKWRGHSDTETLLAAIKVWGLSPTLERLSGMFVIALWDRQEKSLSLARDRMGEKPLYVARVKSGWAFASELKSLHHVSDFKGVLNRDAITAFLAYGYVPDTLCIFQDVFKVPPGGIYQLRAGCRTPKLNKYYELSHDIDAGRSNQRKTQPKTTQQSIQHMENVLSEVIDEQMLSDVPLGCFLSGGVDSSLVAALMQTQSKSSVMTFSIGFKEARFNEAPHAQAVARHLSTDHTEFLLCEDDALGMIKDLPQIYDEPFADSSQIPTTLLCREARKAVTVALTGDGGDEIFGGYNRHVLGPKLLSKLQKIPAPLLRQGKHLAAILGPYMTRENSWGRRVATKMNLPVTAIDKLVSLAPTLSETRDLESLYQSFTRIIHDPNKFLTEHLPPFDIPIFPDVTGAEWIMAMDSVTYLPGDILVKVDRAAMASSLETRAPFLDNRVVAEAWRLPLDMKISSGTGKKILRGILFRHIPEEMINRPKQGFSIPLDRWLRGVLRDWGKDLLDQSELFQAAGLDQTAVCDIWDQHQSYSTDRGAQLWNILTLLDWMKAYQDLINHPNAVLLDE